MAMQPGILDPQMRALDDNVGPSRTQVNTVTSGKGGVGKTNVVANTAIALAQTGKRVLVLDADLGLGNVDILLGRADRPAWHYRPPGQYRHFSVDDPDGSATAHPSR